MGVLGAACLLAGTSRALAHSGHSQREPWDVCKPLTLGEACSWERADHMIASGTCRRVGEALMCVRQHPLRPAVQHEHTPAQGANHAPFMALSLALLLIFVATIWALRRRETS